MTMFTLPNFCRVCLKYDKNLIDLANIENEPGETLMSKLQLCVSEVEWNTFKPLLCHPCIKRLNIAYSFKKQCVQSAGVLKNYVELVKKSQEKNESPSTVKSESILPTPTGAYMLLPNQKYVKILVGPQNQSANTFQNVFLNLIPATTLTPVASPSTQPELKTTTTTKTNKDTNQNVFLNLNNTFQKFIPVASSPVTPTASTAVPSIEVSKKLLPNQIKSPPPLSIPKQNINLNVNQLLTESKSEEVSVEIDPTVFGLEGDDDEDSNDEEEINDYDEVISSAKITLNDFKPNGEKIQNMQNGKDDAKFVPVLPKQQEDFLSSGQHFLFGNSVKSTEFVCETCPKSFASKRLLKGHFSQFHLGKMPFKCEFCYEEFITRGEYENCRKDHHTASDALNKSLTLEDFANNSQSSDISMLEDEANCIPSENGEYFCDVCHRPFNSSTGLLRHKVRKHNQRNRKKYFVKGMKNARCDICNREFSTQSYMQLHRKLHLRDDIGYKYKVFGKSRYGDVEHLIRDNNEKTKNKAEKTVKDDKSEDDKESSSPTRDNPTETFAIKEECDIEEHELKMEVDERSDNEDDDSNASVDEKNNYHDEKNNDEEEDKNDQEEDKNDQDTDKDNENISDEK